MSQRALSVGADDLGTPETTWLASPQLQRVPELSLAALGAPGRVLVLAPHPDDEVLAVGGLLATLARAGWAIDLLAVTDGEGSHPRSPTVTPRELAVRRAQERSVALDRLGIGTARVLRLGCPDAHVGGVHDLREQLAAHLGHDRGVRVCLAPWERDGHPDHDAVGRAAREACREAGVSLLEYPVWAWHWARPERDELPWLRARRVSLDAPTHEAKLRAIAAYRSQIEPLGPGAGDETILLPPVLARFQRPFEILFS